MWCHIVVANANGVAECMTTARVATATEFMPCDAALSQDAGSFDGASNPRLGNDLSDSSAGICPIQLREGYCGCTEARRCNWRFHNEFVYVPIKQIESDFGRPAASS